MGRQSSLSGPIVPFASPCPSAGRTRGAQHHAGRLPWHFPAKHRPLRGPGRARAGGCLPPLPSCFSSELVAQQPLGKEAAGRNTLTWWQLRGHGWSRSKDAFHLQGAPGCDASAGLSYPGELGPGAGSPRLLLICYFLPAAMANICMRYVRRGSAFVTQPLPLPVPAARSRLYGAADAKWFGKEGALSLPKISVRDGSGTAQPPTSPRLHGPREEGKEREQKRLFCRNSEPSLQRFPGCIFADSAVAEPGELLLPRHWSKRFKGAVPGAPMGWEAPELRPRHVNLPKMLPWPGGSTLGAQSLQEVGGVRGC